MKIIAQSSQLIAQINEYKIAIEMLLAERKAIPASITIAQMPEEKRFNKLKQEGKKIKNAIIMLAYQAESAMYNTLRDFYK
jgi:seryl-tRNA synthetase